ncbi:MAG: SDR family oxidoreductase [Parachlamydiaceae bacterium]
MKIGILGCGYVGLAAALRWKKEGHEVTATTRSPEKIPLLKECAHDVHLLNTHPFSSFIHNQEALLVSVAPDSPSEYSSTYLETARLVAKHMDQKAPLRHILYTSSTSVYGNHEGNWVDEATAISHEDENKRILFETEQLFLSCATPDLKICIFRLGEIYGPGREIQGRLRRTSHHSFSGDGNSYTNLIHIDDIVKGLNFALLHDLNGIYNLCSDFHIPRKEFYNELCQQEHLSPVRWDPMKLNPHGGNKRVSNQKMKDAGFMFDHPYFFNRSTKF